MSRISPGQIMARIAQGQGKSVLLNCHKPGLHSIVIEDRKSDRIGMTRVFYAEQGHTLGTWMTDGDFSLLPHNHRQDITLVALWGQVMNITFNFVERDRGLPAHLYKFQSAILNDEIGVEYERPVGLGVGLVKRVPSENDDFYLMADKIHTVAVESPTAAWIVYEGTPTSEPSRCVSLSPTLSLSSAGLYIPADINQIRTQFLKDAAA